MYVIIKKKNSIAFHEEKIMLPDDNGFIPSSSSTNETFFFDLPFFSFSCENFDKVCFAPTEWAKFILISKLHYFLILN